MITFKMTLDEIIEEHPIYHQVLCDNYDYVIETSYEDGDNVYDLIRLEDNIIEHSTHTATEMIDYIDNKEIEALWI